MIKLPIGIDINNLISDLRLFSWEAVDILLYYAKILKDSNDKSAIIKNKNNEDPVTIADLKVNELIISRIKAKYKKINWEILSEENVKNESNKCDARAEWLWVLDPLDGTKDFIQGTGNYAIHLALNYKQKPYIGIVAIPEKEELWISNGDKTWCEKRDRTIIEKKSLKNKIINEMTLVTSVNHRNAQLSKLIDKLSFKRVVRMGSIGCKIASIIRGDADIYIALSLPGKSSPKDWDFAAPEAILNTAGGALTNLDNEDLIYNQDCYLQSGIIIASNNKKTHNNLCLQIKEIIKEHDIYPFEL